MLSYYLETKSNQGEKMKKFFIFMFVCLSFLNASKYESLAFHDIPYQLPAVINSQQYSNFLQFYDVYGVEHLRYCLNNENVSMTLTNNIIYGYTSPYYVSFLSPECSTFSDAIFYYNGSNFVADSTSVLYVDHTRPLTETVRATLNIKSGSNFNLPSGGMAYGRTSFSTTDILVYADPSLSAGPTLTINIEPLEGGSVTGNNISCNVNTSSICQYSLNQVLSSSLQANANCGWAFGHWIGKENPHAVTPSGNTTITAKFFRTLPRNTAAVGFKQSSGYYGDCLEYVEYETELPNDVCNYSAVNCLGQASMKGYTTGNTPKDGAIVIYKQGDGALNNGHAAIVASVDQGANTMVLHEANWNGDGYVHNDRVVDISNAGIMGYIYPAP